MADEKADAKADAKAGDKAKDGKKKSPVMLIGILVGVLVLLLGGSFFLVTKLTAQPAAETGEGEGEGHGKKEGKSGKHAKVEKFEVKDLVLNTGDGSSSRFVKISLAMEFDDPKLEKELEEKEYRVRDLLINLVAHRTAVELASVEVREELRGQILDELNSTIGEGHITEVFFSDFIIQ